MKGSKVISILETLSNKELAKFEDYLNSPLYNKNEILKNVFEALLQFKNDFSNNSLSYEIILAKAYKGKDSKIERLRNDLTLIFKHLKQFLALESFKQNDLLISLSTLKSLREKELDKFLPSEQKQIEKLLEETSSKHEHLYKMIYFDQLDEQYTHSGKREFDPSLQIKMDALDEFYIGEKLKESCNMLNRNAMFQKKYSIKFIDDILHGDEVHLSDFNPNIKIYFVVYKMLQSNERAEFDELLRLLEQHSKALQSQEQRALYTHAQNFCTRKINNGHKEYFKDVFNIFQKLIEYHLILVDGYIPHATYKNIVTTALNVDRFEWAGDFIEEYKEQINPSVKENAYRYNLAQYKYAIGQIDEAVNLLQTVSYKDNYYQLGSRYLLLTILYETNEHESLLYNVDAFKLYLKRNKNFGIEKRENTITFLKLLRKTSILKNRKPYLHSSDFEKRCEKLETEFMKNRNIPYLKWLEAKILELTDNRNQ